MEFTNSSLDISKLPSISDIHFHHLNTKYRSLLQVEGFISFFVFTIAVGIGCFKYPVLMTWPIVVLVIFIWVIVSTAILYFGFSAWKYKGYALREHDILYKTGIFFRSTVVIAFNRVQHVEIQQGPLDRLFSLSSMTLFTAGGSSSDVTVPGLHPDQASRLKNIIMQSAARDEEE